MSHDAAPLFAGWEKGMILSCLQGHMGQVRTRGGHPPESALCAIGDFCFFAGRPDPALVRQADRPLLVPRTGDWAPVIRTVWGRRAVPFLRYALCGAPEDFDRDRLAAFNFRGEDVFKSVSVLSGGEQSRLRLCMLMDDEINLLVLDEPTNHLDIASREWIEEAVEAYEGALLFVSHDRYFINRFATRVWELENGIITDYPVPFQRYREIKERQKALAQEKAREEKKAADKLAAKEKAAVQRGGKAQQAARKQLTIVQREIDKLEAAIKDKEAELEANACDYEKYSALYAEKEQMDEELLTLMERWEQLSEEAEG